MALRGVSAECGDLAICWDAEDNLSPKPYDGDWNAHDKDRLENEFKKMVCVDKTITLEEAQCEISTEWIAAYKEYIGECNPFAEVKHCKYTNCYSHWRTERLIYRVNVIGC